MKGEVKAELLESRILHYWVTDGIYLHSSPDQYYFLLPLAELRV